MTQTPDSLHGDSGTGVFCINLSAGGGCDGGIGRNHVGGLENRGCAEICLVLVPDNETVVAYD